MFVVLLMVGKLKVGVAVLQFDADFLPAGTMAAALYLEFCCFDACLLLHPTMVCRRMQYPATCILASEPHTIKFSNSSID